MKKTFAICKGQGISNQFMARGLGGIIGRVIITEVIRLKSYITKSINLISKLNG